MVDALQQHDHNLASAKRGAAPKGRRPRRKSLDLNTTARKARTKGVPVLGRQPLTSTMDVLRAERAQPIATTDRSDACSSSQELCAAPPIMDLTLLGLASPSSCAPEPVGTHRTDSTQHSTQGSTHRSEEPLSEPSTQRTAGPGALSVCSSVCGDQEYASDDFESDDSDLEDKMGNGEAAVASMGDVEMAVESQEPFMWAGARQMQRPQGVECEPQASTKGRSWASVSAHELLEDPFPMPPPAVAKKKPAAKQQQQQPKQRRGQAGAGGKKSAKTKPKPTRNK
eukprot:TRINITY_DN1573_c0_g1_i5.p1 TRINITY_DN1573_c0_g1~~TRINITY_DN1573_c0_g1_i5.p1  ORF type:complete len:283 (-),score=83.84 TRINITY_DN1573_c0_g1_i5:187-1035(-)